MVTRPSIQDGIKGRLAFLEGKEEGVRGIFKGNRSNRKKKQKEDVRLRGKARFCLLEGD